LTHTAIILIIIEYQNLSREEGYGMTKIRELRQGQGLKLIDLAYETRIHPTQLGDIERGRRAASARAKEKICSFLGVEPGELFNGNGLAV
jgi:transcriptional regulator with XRE-family HTH domain